MPNTDYSAKSELDMRLTIASLIVLVSNTLAFGQIKIDGPKEAEVGYRLKAKLTLDVTDPQIKCFPANDDWYAVQDFSGNKFIDFVPGKKIIPPGQKQQLVTFVVAGFKDKKTYLETYEVIVKAEEATPVPVPVPEPEKTQLYKDLLAAYKVSPNADALKLHIKLYSEMVEEIKADKFSTAKAAGDALAAKFLNVKDLESVQVVVADYLKKNAGQTWNKAKVQAAFETIVATLKTVPA